MDWDTQLSSILSTTDSSMARIRERLNTAGSFSKDELGDSLHMKSLLYQEPSPSYLEPLPPRMERGDLTGVHTQLQSQSQAIESLTQTVLKLEKDRELQQHRIQTLEDELGDSLHMKRLLYQEPSPSYLEPLPPRMDRGDLTGVHTQLQSQSQAIESLTQTVLKLEKDRELQQHRIQTLEDELGDSLHMKRLLYQEPSPSYLEPLPPRMDRGDLTGVHTQLQSQSQAIESLTQTVLKLEKDRELQQHRIQTLEEEVRRLRTHGEEEQRRSPERRLERRVEEWKREVTSELYSLRAQLQREAERAGSQGQQDIQDSKKLLREECETLRREVEHIKLQLSK
ncbi:UNVERIFIED_CONTAM: hypothetical protein FKN15_031864 [Acipenser sinensis]